MNGLKVALVGTFFGGVVIASVPVVAQPTTSQINLKDIAAACSGLETATATGGRGKISTSGGYDFEVSADKELTVSQSGRLISKIKEFTYQDYTKCVTELTVVLRYPPAPLPKLPATIKPAWQLSAPPRPSPAVPLPLQCSCVSKEIVSEKPVAALLNGVWRRVSGQYNYINHCDNEVTLSLSKWENSPARQYFVSVVTLDPGNSVAIQMLDVAPDPELRVTVVECPHALNPYTGQPQPIGGGARGCFVERATFAARGKPWARTMCVASTPGVAGRPCTCELPDGAYPGVYVGPE